MKQEFFSKAKENLKIAQLSFEHGCYNACANRAYYAAFQAAKAALAAHGIQSAGDNHSWIQSEFNIKLIKKRKIYPAKLKSYLLNIKTEMEAINFVLRQFDTDIQLAEITLEDAGTFNFEEI